MSDYKSRFEKLRQDAKEKFDEIDKQIGIKDKIGEGARVVGETAQKGAQRIKTEAERSEVGKQAVRAAEETRAELTCDGRILGCIEAGERLQVKAAKESITLLHPPGHDYYKLLRSKLHWGRGSVER